MPALIHSFQDLYNRVSKYLGTYGSSGPTGNDLTDAKAIVNDAYRRFIDAYEWSFLKPEQTIITSSGTWEYQLPEDFGNVIGTINYGADETNPPLEQRSVGQIRNMRAENDWSSYPEYWALRSNYTKEFGQRYDLLFYPTPDAAYPLWFTYRMEPAKLESDSDIPIGGSECSGVMLQLCLAEAESQMEEIAGVQEQKAAGMLAQAIQRDVRKKPHSLGYFGVDTPSAREIARGSILTSKVLFDGSTIY